MNDNETRIDCFEEILYYIDNFSDEYSFDDNPEEEIVEPEEGERTGSLQPMIKEQCIKVRDILIPVFENINGDDRECEEADEKRE